MVLAAVLAAAAEGSRAWLQDSSGGHDRSADHDDDHDAAVAPVTLRIIFPEGFTRREMVARVGAVRAIAIRKRDVRRSSPRPRIAR